ncbi:LpqB family beta-propeller domain-containing protein, partial [Crossiella equi]
MKRRGLRALCAVGVVLTAAACAAIPENTELKAIPTSAGEPGRASTVDAPKGLEDPAVMVRNFVGASAKPESSRSEARQYLVPELQKSWDDRKQLTVIDDDFATLVSSGGDSDNQTVSVRGKRIGTLGQDGDFTPDYKELDLSVPVRRSGSQWRIVTPPQEVLVTRTGMDHNYKPVRLAFLAPDSPTVVRDLRYISLRPTSTLPQRTMDLLIKGPSQALRNAVRTALPGGANLVNNVTDLTDGAVGVNLTGLADVLTETRQLIAAQVVLSLQTVSNSRIRLLSDGVPLLPPQQDWRAGDVAKYEARTSPSPEAKDMAVVQNTVRYLLTENDGRIPGAAGSGELSVVTASQSPTKDGPLAVVARAGNNVNLRIGGPRELYVAATASDLSRPTWRLDGKEVWTVVDHTSVQKFVDQGKGNWQPVRVNAEELLNKVSLVRELRLSRDGVRVAAIAANQTLWVGSVVNDGGTTSIRAVRQVGAGLLSSLVGLDWYSADTMVVA